MEKENTASLAFATLVGALFLTACFIILQGIVFAHLWGWYISPLGIPPLGYAHAIMILIMARLVTVRVADKQDSNKAWEKVCRAAAIWLFAWGLGYLLSPFAI